MSYIYRGESPYIFKTNRGKLRPKGKGLPFYHCSYGENALNNIGDVKSLNEAKKIATKCLAYKHQYTPNEEQAKRIVNENHGNFRDSDLYTIGISTTPVFERAKYYALNGNKNPWGIIYVIDRDKLQELGVREIDVSNHENPRIIEDNEIILQAEDGGILPDEIILAYCKIEK